ncbi:hypothetical protein STEG23_033344 [Scotinomys teguina]
MKPSEEPDAPSRHRLTLSQRCPPSIPPPRPLPPRPVTGCKQTLPAATPVVIIDSLDIAKSKPQTPSG